MPCSKPLKTGNLKTDKMQKGVALLLFFMALLLAGSTFILAVIPDNKKAFTSESITTQALAKAKTALIAYAVTNYYRSGSSTGSNLLGLHAYLPCVEGNSANPSIEGRQTGGCPMARKNALGRLPWKSLKTSPLKDSSGQCLWYAVTYAYTQNSNLLHNPDSLGMFDIYNISGSKINTNQPEDRIVAVVFAPGKQLSGQSRNAVNNNLPCGQSRDQVNVSDFLESISGINNTRVSSSTDQIDSFVGIDAGQYNSNFNDRLVTITRSEIYNAILQHKNTTGSGLLNQQLVQLGIALGNCLIEYSKLADSHIDPLTMGHFKFPWAAPLNLENNNFNDDYRNNSHYSDQTLLQIGRYPFIVDLSNTAIGFIPPEPPLINIFSQTQASVSCDLSSLTNRHRRLWNDWKDNIFYISGENYQPNTNTLSSCSSLSCPSVNGLHYPALLLIGNTRSNTQLRRDSDIEPLPQTFATLKGSISNYLEADNLTNFINNTPQGDFSDNTGNDIQICINPATTSVLCP